MSLRPFVLATVAALSLAACATGGSNRAEVTRFHLNQPIARGTIQLVPQQSWTAGQLEFRSVADSIAPALAAQGFQPVVPPASADLIGIVDFSQGVRQGSGRGSGFSIGIGGGSFGRHGGIGGGVTLPIGQAKPNDIVVSTLALQIKRRSDGSVVWEGRASGEGRSGSADASPSAIAPRLAAALLAGFPGASGQTVRVQL